MNPKSKYVRSLVSKMNEAMGNHAKNMEMMGKNKLDQMREVWSMIFNDVRWRQGITVEYLSKKGITVEKYDGIPEVAEKNKKRGWRNARLRNPSPQRLDLFFFF